jgi:ornithine carbamoyltransferase
LAIQRATSDLGARVALIPSHLDSCSATGALEQTAHVLGRLYDAVICIDLSPEVVRQLRLSCGVPVLADVASQWLALRAARPEVGEDPRYLMQELLAAIGV